MNSKNRNQLELLPSAQPLVEPVTPELIARVCRRETIGDAWNYAQDVSGLENKVCAGALEMDESQWNKIRKGIYNPPSDHRFNQFEKLVNNNVLLIWHCESNGFDFLSMQRHRSSLERENEELREDLANHKRALRLVMEAQK